MDEGIRGAPPGPPPLLLQGDEIDNLAHLRVQVGPWCGVRLRAITDHRVERYDRTRQAGQGRKAAFQEPDHPPHSRSISLAFMAR